MWLQTHPDERNDLNGAGDDGESVYGEKADIRLVLGEGMRGDFNAIIVERLAVDERLEVDTVRATVEMRR